MNRKLAVPLALRDHRCEDRRTRKIRALEDDPEETCMVTKLAENRSRLERLRMDIRDDPFLVDSEDTASELDYIKTTIQLELLEITGELEEIPSSDEIFSMAYEEAVA